VQARAPVKIGSQKASEGVAGKATATSLGTSKSASEEATADEGEQKENEMANHMEVSIANASGMNKTSIDKASVMPSPLDIMFGPFKPDALQTPVSSTWSELPPPINSKKGISLGEFYGGGVALLFPHDNATNREEEQYHEDDDDDNNDDNIDLNAVHVQKHHQSLAGVVVQ